MSPLTPAQWRQARELFEQAVDDPPADPDGWLAARTGDPAVRQEVASLLHHHSRAGAFLTQPLGDLAALLDGGGAEADADEPYADEADAGEAPLIGGQAIGPYRVELEVGRGGMGRVYRAVDTRLNRTVAIKALPAALASDRSQRERLRREARAAAALTHPGICTVYALEEFDGRLFIVTEFIDGQTLRAAIAGGARPTAAAVIDTAGQLASALASAHAAGIVHRDLKPENVMRSADGRVKILDFGLSRQQESGGGGGAAALVTQPGVVIGTPAYMAPEQLEGQPADARTDVFAFGMLIYEFATGQHPFAAATAIARAGRILSATADSLGLTRPDLPEPFVRAIDRCIAKSPGDRFASALELAAALTPSPAPSPALAGSASPAAELRHSPLGPSASAVAPADAGAAGTGRAWWRVHQCAVVGLYLTAVILAWFIKEWLRGEAVRGLTAWGFVALGVLGMTVGMLRGHLLFTERTHGAGLPGERRRLSPVTLAGDLVMALVLAADGVALIAASREVAAVLTIALAVAIAVARLVLEPGTARAAFGDGSGA